MRDQFSNIMLCLHGTTNIYAQKFEGKAYWQDRYGNIMTDENGVALYDIIDVDEYGTPISTQQPVLFTTDVADIKSQVNSLLYQGYTIVNSEDYKKWIAGEWTPTTPIACVMYDDALSSLQYIMEWHIAENIPASIAVITRRQRKKNNEDGFASWAMLNDWVTRSNGQIDLVCHTHDLHHLSLHSYTDNAFDVIADPILEGPCWIDNGEYLYIPDGEGHDWYWNQSWVEQALAIPLYGVDQYDGTKLIETSFHITPRITDNVAIIRFWSSLAKPSGTGYDVPIQIWINDTQLVFDGIIKPKDYGTRIQWVEREWNNINLDTPFAVEAGVTFKMTFKTMAGHTGGPHLTCYCTFTDDTSKFYATTNCEGYTPYNADASPQKWWQYIDYPAGDKWSVKPVMILGNGTGRTVPQAEYDDYINTDIQRSQFAVTNYLKATWTEKSVWSGSWDNWNIYWDGDFSQDEQIWDADTGYQLTGWSYPKRVSAIFPTMTDTTCSVEYLKFDFEEKVPVEIPSSQWWDETEVDSGITKWDDSQTRQYNIQFLIEVSEDKVNWTTVGKAPSWTILKDDTKGNAAEIEPTIWTAGVTKYVRLTPINDGPTIGEEQHVVYMVSQVRIGIKDANTPLGKPFTQIAYPFGAYQANWKDENPLHPDWHDISSGLTNVFESNGIHHGYTIQAIRNVRHNGEDIGYNQRLSKFVLGRLMTHGITDPIVLNHFNMTNADVCNNLIALYAGYMFANTKHNGLKWQVSLEGDLLGHGTLKKRVDTIDYFAFDAWAFSGTNPPDIVRTSAPVNDGTNFEGDWGAGYYADEKKWLQERGALALIIINNNLGTGSPDSVAGKHVLDNPDAYIAKIVEYAKRYGWDGVTCNIEGVDVTANDWADWIYRDRATEFYKKLGRACHQNGLLLHCTAPASTGNENYDWASWVGWCDHAEIIKYVDGMKIMSYTESHEGSEPRPAAWDVAPLTKYNSSGPTDSRSFWQAVTEYTATVIPDQFKKRILMGGRAFGHVWYPNWKTGETPPEILSSLEWFNPNDEYWKYAAYLTDDDSQYKDDWNHYITYGELINKAATEIVPIIQDTTLDTTEMYFYNPKTEVKAWCGSPLTGARSQTTAKQNGFGGVGIWKIDDGDIEEYYPEFKSFGKSTLLYRK
ncbi:hypothetical protein G0029_17690 (plasmid) [Acinetobacter sp. YH12138]|uniref:hypothetical protein n=1 Tax=Acinetobacter sp. YH12138 TaxID=2601122 RepID=UPI0015D37E39|nr:hypothetical protein [Acinetobacter sp. YH12138]QOW51599.1 hypothetical protein G0029_17690 [Acinetobacter sp. YH12138]